MPVGGILGINHYSSCEVGGFFSVSHLRPYLHPICVDFPIFSHPIMFMESTATTLAMCDSTLGDEHEIVGLICVLTATQDNDTALHPGSFQEKDIVKLCIGLGQVHLEGMLWLSDTKMVLTFWSSSKMMAVTCLFTAAMVWHDVPIKICVCPPMGAQVR